MNSNLWSGLLATAVVAGGAAGSAVAEPQAIPGYTLGAAGVPKAPISLDDLEQLKEVLLFGPEDERALRMSREVLADQVEEVLDVWYGFVASKPQLVRYFADAKSGEPNAAYLGAVRKRFGQWILDTAAANYDQAWLDYQFEIGRRHHTVGKNRTDGVDSVPIIHFRYIPALHYAVTTTIRPFLASKGHSAAEVDAMHEAWRKSVQLQVILWSYPYVRDGQF